MQITNQSGVGSPIDLIPHGFLCWVMVNFKGMKNGSKENDLGRFSRYADVELTIADQQPYARKKVFTTVGDPDSENNTDGYRQMGMTALTRMVEAAGIVNPEEPASYEKLNGKSIEQVMSMLDGKYVAIKVKFSKGSGGYDDKNEVGEFLTPNAQSQSNKHFIKLTNGDHGITANPAQQRQGGSGFGNQGGGAPVASRPVTTGFGNAQQQPVQSAPAAPAPQERAGFNPNNAPQFLKAAQHP